MEPFGDNKLTQQNLTNYQRLKLQELDNYTKQVQDQKELEWKFKNEKSLK